MKEAFPDSRFEIKRLIEQGEYVSGEMIQTGTNTGTIRFPPGSPIRELPATGKSVRLPYAGFAHVVNDLIVEDTTYSAIAGLFAQLGLDVQVGSSAVLPVVQKMWDAWNAGDKAAYMATASPDVVMDEGRPSERRGETSWAEDWNILHTAFPDIAVEMTNALSMGDRCAIEAHVTGTQTGPLLLGAEAPGAAPDQLAATGKTISLDVSMFYRVKEGLIVSEQAHGWMEPILIQLGAVAAPHVTA